MTSRFLCVGFLKFEAVAGQPHNLFTRLSKGAFVSSISDIGAAHTICSMPSSYQDEDVCIIAGARTPMGGFQGSLAAMTAPQLGSIAIRGALERSGVDGKAVEEVYMGNVLSAGIGQAPSRQAALGAGLPDSIPCTDVNKVCASGMKAVMLASQSIQLGQNDVVIAGGMESMSNAPYYLPKARSGYRLGNAEVVDGLVKDGLWDPYGNIHMGRLGETCALHFEISRDHQDTHALRSWERAKAASDAGLFESEIVPVHVPAGRGKATVVVKIDESLEKMDAEKLRELRPVFMEGGSITAGNASPISDGAAAMILTSGAFARKHGLQVQAIVRAYADAAQAPEWFTTTPSIAIRKALARAGRDVSEVDYFEINEAFSIVDLANQHILSLDSDRVNAHGGAVALGHPIGCSGARIILSLANTLSQRNSWLGVASICNGGGGASAIVIQRLRS